MWQTLTWWARLEQPDVARGVEELRGEALGMLLAVTALAGTTWYVIDGVLTNGTGRAPELILRRWLLLALVLGGLLAIGLLLRRRAQLAIGLFPAWAILAVTSAVGLLEQPRLTLLYPIAVLAAVVLLHPLAGLLATAAATGGLAALHLADPAALPPERLLETGAACLLTVVVAWMLGRNLVIVADWSSKSYTEARRHAGEARASRAELLGALKQLDLAYYRLQRANAALELAWQAADAAERSKTEFVTNISHELRTPLNLVIGFSELVLTSPESYGAPLPAAYRGDLAAIHRSAQHLLALTNDVIDLARVGIGRLALAREPVDLAEVLHEAAGIVREYVQAKGLWLRLETPPDLPPLLLDRLRVRQVALNLLTNAVRFTPRGGICVAARCEGDGVRVTVTDTGAGIAPEALTRVFDEFIHGDDGRDPRLPGLGGVGLGLPLSRRLIALHGGQMGVESRLGEGSSFWFTLPAADADETRPAPLARPAPPARPAERLLVLASADEGLAGFLRRHLAGYTVATAADEAGALALAVEVSALAVIADEGDGPPATAPVPIVRLPLPGGARLAAQLGVAGLLPKPVTAAGLQTALGRLPRPPRSALVVDDDPTFVRLMARLLGPSARSAGTVVVPAHTGREALARLAAATPDLILLDLELPDMDGAELLAALRATPALAEVPVIVVSARDPLRAPLAGSLSLRRPEGLTLEEALGALEALLGALAPPRHYPVASPAPASGS